MQVFQIVQTTFFLFFFLSVSLKEIRYELVNIKYDFSEWTNIYTEHFFLLFLQLCKLVKFMYSKYHMIFFSGQNPSFSWQKRNLGCAYIFCVHVERKWLGLHICPFT